MRAILTALGALALLAAAPMPAFAHHKLNHVIPTAGEAGALRTHRDPCNSVSHNPHEFIALRAMEDHCRRLMAQRAAHPDDAALRADCDHAARALAGTPC